MQHNQRFGHMKITTATIATLLLMLVVAPSKAQVSVSYSVSVQPGDVDLNGVEKVDKPRARDLGIAPGVLGTGTLNAITDVGGLLVGHVTLIQGDNIRTGVTAILPHGGNLYQQKVPAGFAVANGYGKFAGTTQILELGEIETPIVLTNTLSVPQGMEGIIDWTLAQSGNEGVRSVNAIVGETNDGYLNDIRGRHVRAAHVVEAI